MNPRGIVRLRAPRRDLRYLAGAISGLGLLLALVYLVGQLVLPTFAADRIASSLKTHASGVSVSVTADPALELLLGHADRVTVVINDLYPTHNHTHVGTLLERTGATAQLAAHVRHAWLGPLEVTNVRLEKNGPLLRAQATVTRAALAAALPLDLHLAEQSPDSHTLLLKASLHILGHVVSGTAAILIDGGRLVIAPDNPLLSTLRLTLFSDSQIAVQSVTAVAGRQGFTFSATARFHQRT